MGKRNAEVERTINATADFLDSFRDTPWTEWGGDAKAENTSVPTIRKLEPMTTTWPGEVGRPRNWLVTLSILTLVALLAISLVALVF